MRDIQGAKSLEEAKECARDAEAELMEIIRRYEMRRRAQENQGEDNIAKVG
jgi:hypothetical protein